MKVAIIYRNGEVKLRVPAEVSEGILLAVNGGILINSDLITPGQKERIIRERKEGKLTEEMKKMGMKLGDNGNGLIVRWADDVETEERAKAQAAYDALPVEVKMARKERKEIDRLYSISHKSLNYDTDDDNVMRGYSTGAKADAMLKSWREKYPKMAMLEDADNLDAKALKQDSLASGALIYDSDGWLSPDDQQRRHDEFKTEAAKLRTEAQTLRESANV